MAGKLAHWKADEGIWMDIAIGIVTAAIPQEAQPHGYSWWTGLDHDSRSVNTQVWFIVGHFVFTDRCSIEARPMRKRLIFQCDCFARFAVVHRHLADDYESSSHSKAEVRKRDWRKRVSGIENRLSWDQSGSWAYRLLGHNRYKPSGACTGRECGEKWRILRIRWITEKKVTLCNITVFNTALHTKIHNAANNHDISYLAWAANLRYKQRARDMPRAFFFLYQKTTQKLLYFFTASIIPHAKDMANRGFWICREPGSEMYRLIG